MTPQTRFLRWIWFALRHAPGWLLRDCPDVLKNDPELVGAQSEATFQDGDDVARLEIGTDCAVDGANLGNSIIFALRGSRRPSRHTGALRVLKQLDEASARQLATGFARILTAFKYERQ